jgi:hypothetical protein
MNDRNSRLLAACAFVALVAFMPVRAARALPLCLPPLVADCIMPQWGMVEPEGLDASRAAPSVAASSNVMRMLPVAAHDDRMRARSSSNAARMLIDDGRDYRDPTRKLISAIRRASFDREGRLVSGDRAIAAAAAALYPVSRNHQLNLYVKTPTQFSKPRNEVLLRKVAAVNKILHEAAGTKPAAS